MNLFEKLYISRIWNPLLALVQLIGHLLPVGFIVWASIALNDHHGAMPFYIMSTGLFLVVYTMFTLTEENNLLSYGWGPGKLAKGYSYKIWSEIVGTTVKWNGILYDPEFKEYVYSYSQGNPFNEDYIAAPHIRQPLTIFTANSKLKVASEIIKAAKKDAAVHKRAAEAKRIADSFNVKPISIYAGSYANHLAKQDRRDALKARSIELDRENEQLDKEIAELIAG
jgi:hypothetical protein